MPAHPRFSAATLLKLIVQLYRNMLSPLMLPVCKFSPSCSDYALQALERHGALKGSWLTTKRLFRCHPFSQRLGADPVP